MNERIRQDFIAGWNLCLNGAHSHVTVNSDQLAGWNAARQYGGDAEAAADSYVRDVAIVQRREMVTVEDDGDVLWAKERAK